MLVSILMGSRSDWDTMLNASDVLKRFSVPHEMKVLSAHRTPNELKAYLDEAEKKGVKIFIAGAGFAAHLAGVIASHTCLPVLGVPLDSSPLNGLDSLLSTVQMPSGIPVATFAIGKAGAANSAIFAAEILATGDEEMLKKIRNYRQEKARSQMAGG